MTMTNTLAETFLPQARTQLAYRTMLVACGVVLLAMSSKVQVPFWPVPMTLQTSVVLLIAATYGLRNATSTLLSYIAAGAAGLPVFASGAGLAYMAGPTGGYLAGFLCAAIMMGWLADRGWGRGLASAGVMLLLGQIVIFGFGVAWLAALIGPAKAVAGGLLPFLPAEVLKTALAAAVLAASWKRATTS
jgi:biotin transport system substrate-specific component